MKQNLLAFSLLSFTSFSCFADLTLPSFFSDNMLMQQNDNAAIWGTDAPNTSITISGSWGAKISTKTDNLGNWRLKIPTSSAGLGHTLTIEGSDVKKIKNVALGDVWLCSGQSNMKITLKGNPNQPIMGSTDAILNSANKNIRLFNVKQTVSLTPQYDVTGEWQQASPKSVVDFGATCYFFGKKLNDVLDTPIGLILSAYGAASAEAWTSKEVLLKLGNVPIENQLREVRKQTTPTVLYNGMLHPLVGYTIKGFTWYQGENNRPRASDYTKLFSTMIEQWRTDWQQGNLPFYFVQLAPYGTKKDIEGALLREAQLHTMAKVKNSGMVTTMDIGVCNNIHPPFKEEVGDRLAYWAFANDYGYDMIAYSGPIVNSFEVKGTKVSLTFDHAINGLTSFGKALSGFVIAGEDKIFHPATAKIEKDTSLTVWSNAVKKPVALRYGFQNCPTGTLFNTEGLPASSFRTDNWSQ